MLVLQHNCARTAAVVHAALEATLEAGAGIACLQEPPVGKNDISHPGFMLYWPEGPRKDTRVVTAVRRDIVDKIVIEARTDLANHPYFMVIDVIEEKRRTRVVNCYDNWLGAPYTYAGASQRTRRALTDINWNPIFTGRCLLLGDFNAHSPEWNALITTRENAETLERLITKHDLFINNDRDRPTRPYKTAVSRDGCRGGKVPSTSIIDLTITNQTLGPLASWEMEAENLTTSDHLVILASWESLETEGSPNEGTVTGWQIGALMADQEALELARHTWNRLTEAQPKLTDTCLPEDVEEEAERIEKSLTDVLQKYAKTIRLCARSKRWWGPPTKKARGLYSKARKAYQAGEIR